MPANEEAAAEIAKRSRGTPRIANRLLRRIRDYSEVRHNGQLSAEIAKAALTMLEVDPYRARQPGLPVLAVHY